jgi:perosamine synthetase
MSKIKWQQPSIGKEEISAVSEVLQSGILENGIKCREFERLIREVTKAKYAIVVSSGTAALHCAIRAIERRLKQSASCRNVQAALIVSVPTFSYIATANSVISNNHILNLVDSAIPTWNINPSKISSSCNVLLPVDIGGLPCNYDELKALNKFILQDASEALGASYKQTPCGSISDVTVFSFHSSKIVTTGEGGAITTNDSELYDFMVRLKSQGNSLGKTFWEYKHDVIGYNYRMTEMQAAMGVEQIKKLPMFLERRRTLVKLYKELLGDVGVYQEVPEGVVHSNWLFAFLLKSCKLREPLCKYLLSQGIEVRTTWKPIHLQPAYSNYNFLCFPIAEKIGKSIISLPLNNKTTTEEVTIVAGEVKKFIRSHI